MPGPNLPDGYWSRVYRQATKLMRDQPSIGGDAAFSMARVHVDKENEAAGPQTTISLDRLKAEILKLEAE